MEDAASLINGAVHVESTLGIRCADAHTAVLCDHQDGPEINRPNLEAVIRGGVEEMPFGRALAKQTKSGVVVPTVFVEEGERVRETRATKVESGLRRWRVDPHPARGTDQELVVAGGVEIGIGRIGPDEGPRMHRPGSPTGGKAVRSVGAIAQTTRHRSIGAVSVVGFSTSNRGAATGRPVEDSSRNRRIKIAGKVRNSSADGGPDGILDGWAEIACNVADSPADGSSRTGRKGAARERRAYPNESATLLLVVIAICDSGPSEARSSDFDGARPVDCDPA